jgi:hypothetical protein
MAWFSKAEKWEETFRLNSRTGGGRGFCSGMFWLWGIGGFGLIGFEFLALTGSIGVGTSSYIAAQAIFWIGGMIMFGLGAMIDAPDYSAVKRAQDEYGDVRVSR